MHANGIMETPNPRLAATTSCASSNPHGTAAHNATGAHRPPNERIT